jgi:hypothetical protein
MGSALEVSVTKEVALYGLWAGEKEYCLQDWSQKQTADGPLLTLR